MLYVPGIIVFVTFAAAATVPPAGRLIVDGLKAISGPLALLGDIVADIERVPEKKFLLKNASTNVEFEPSSTVRLVWETRVKSAMVPEGGGKTRGRWSMFIPSVCPHLLHRPATQVSG